MGIKKAIKTRFAKQFVNKMGSKGKAIQKDYNGYENYETWGFVLIWENDYGMMSYTEEMANEAGSYGEFVDNVRGEVNGILDEISDFIQQGNMFVQQLCLNSVSAVDVEQVVESICGDFKDRWQDSYSASAKKSATAKLNARVAKQSDPLYEQLRTGLAQNYGISLAMLELDDNGDYIANVYNDKSVDEATQALKQFFKYVDLVAEQNNRYIFCCVDETFSKSAKKAGKSAMGKATKKSKIKKDVEGFQNFYRLADTLSNTKEILDSALEDLNSLIGGEYNGTLIEGIPRGYDFDIKAVQSTLKNSVIASLDSIIDNLLNSMHYEASAKKSATAKASAPVLKSFKDNVDSVRKANYQKIGKV